MSEFVSLLRLIHVGALQQSNQNCFTLRGRYMQPVVEH